MPDPTERVLGLDPSLRGTGYAILERGGRRTTALDFGVIRNPPSLLQSGCLRAIHEKVRELLAQWSPTAMAVEGVIYVQSFKTAITLGAARGSAILAAAQSSVPVFEYAPRRVKQAIAGAGGAQKAQVAFMVRALLKLAETPPPDAADALAIALTHFQSCDAASARQSVLTRV